MPSDSVRRRIFIHVDSQWQLYLSIGQRTHIFNLQMNSMSFTQILLVELCTRNGESRANKMPPSRLCAHRLCCCNDRCLCVYGPRWCVCATDNELFISLLFTRISAGWLLLKLFCSSAVRFILIYLYPVVGTIACYIYATHIMYAIACVCVCTSAGWACVGTTGRCNAPPSEASVNDARTRTHPTQP